MKMVECFYKLFIISNNAFQNPTQPGGGQKLASDGFELGGNAEKFLP